MADDLYDESNPFFLYNADMLCALCTRKLEADKTCALTTPIHEHSIMKAYQVLQSISQFKYTLGGPQSVCNICFKNIASTYKFQQICNKAQELFNKFTQYQEEAAERIDEHCTEEIQMEISGDDGEDGSAGEVEHKTIQIIKISSGDKKFKCKYCPASFNSRNARQFHINLHNRVHVCSFCDRALGSKSKLEVHERTHTGERPFPCEHCDWAFKTKEGLQHHTLIHTKERPWVCEVCTKTFNRRSTLRKHLAIHTGLKPHKCPECNRNFRDSYSLKSHRKTHEKKKRDAISRMKKVKADIKEQLQNSEEEEEEGVSEQVHVVKEIIEEESNSNNTE